MASSDVGNIFALNRRQHSIQFHLPFHQVLELVENVAETWNETENPVRHIRKD
jgi:hypothetical protein